MGGAFSIDAHLDVVRRRERLGDAELHLRELAGAGDVEVGEHPRLRLHGVPTLS